MDDANQPIPPAYLEAGVPPVPPEPERRSGFRPHMLLRPSGFVLVLMCFALPFLTVSCDSPAFSASATYTGFDLATGGRPTVESGSLATDQTTEGTAGQEDGGLAGVQPLAIVILGLLVAAAVVVSVVPGRLRLWLGAAAAILLAVLLAVNQAVVHRSVVDALHQALAKTQDQAADPGSALPNFQLDEAKLVHTRFGFWLALALLVLVAIYYVARAATAGRALGHLLAARLAPAGPPATEPRASEPPPGEWARPPEPPG